MRRIGVLLGATADDMEFQAWVGAFRQALQELGWIDGRNVRIDTHWRRSMSPEFANTQKSWPHSRRTSFWPPGASTVGPLLQATRTVPVVFPIMASRRRRLHRQPGAAWRQRHRLYRFSNTA